MLFFRNSWQIYIVTTVSMAVTLVITVDIMAQTYKYKEKECHICTRKEETCIQWIHRKCNCYECIYSRYKCGKPRALMEFSLTNDVTTRKLRDMMLCTPLHGCSVLISLINIMKYHFNKRANKEKKYIVTQKYFHWVLVEKNLTI